MDTDVVVLGGGNAALCAAISARHENVRVLLLERAPANQRGGNTRHTRDIRYSHPGPSNYATGAYPEAEFMEDLLRVTGGETNMPLATLTVRASESVPGWMERHGVKWQLPLRGTLHLSRTNGFFLGGGKAMVNTYFDTAQRMGVGVAYGATARDFIVEDGDVRGIVVEIDGKEQRIGCHAVVAASGGFEANIPWLREYWGAPAENFIVRGAKYNDGIVLRAMLGIGAQPVGDPKGLHAIAVDARSPKYDGGIITRVDAIPFGIVVNKHAKRFYDEGEDLWPKRYAIWGGLIAQQADQIAYSVFDAKAYGRFIPSVFPPFKANSLGELARECGLDATAFIATVTEFNAAVNRSGTFQLSALDDCSTSGIAPPKTHWALPIEDPPYYAYPVRPGITFTYLGVAVDESARVLQRNGEPVPNLYAAGEVMAGNILSRGYLAGFGLTIGTVFGRIAGREAGRHAAQRTIGRSRAVLHA